MANTFNTVNNAPGILAKISAGLLKDKVQFVKAIDKEDASTFGESYLSGQPGNTIFVQKPARFTIRQGSTQSIQDITEEKVALVIGTKIGVDVTVSSNQLATDIAMKTWAKRVLDPAVSRLAQEVEANTLLASINATANLVGTPGVPVNSLLTYLQANQKLDEFLAPMDDQRKVLINPAANTASVDALKGLFQSSEQIKSQYESGYMGTAAGFDFMRNNLLPTITSGTQPLTGVTVTTTSTNGASTIALTGTGTNTITVGTVFTVANVFAVHPITKVSLGYLQQFEVTATSTATGGAYTVAITPAIYSSAGLGLQNVTALPQSGAAVVFQSAAAVSTGYVNNLAFHPSAYRFCSVPLIMPNDVSFKAQETNDGITVRVLQQYTINDDTMPLRVDILFGSCAVRPEWGVRLTN